jgi:hypothetical protein
VQPSTTPRSLARRCFLPARLPDSAMVAESVPTVPRAADPSLYLHACPRIPRGKKYVAVSHRAWHMAAARRDSGILHLSRSHRLAAAGRRYHSMVNHYLLRLNKASHSQIEVKQLVLGFSCLYGTLTENSPECDYQVPFDQETTIFCSSRNRILALRAFSLQATEVSIAPWLACKCVVRIQQMQGPC